MRLFGYTRKYLLRMQYAFVVLSAHHNNINRNEPIHHLPKPRSSVRLVRRIYRITFCCCEACFVRVDCPDINNTCNNVGFDDKPAVRVDVCVCVFASECMLAWAWFVFCRLCRASIAMQIMKQLERVWRRKSQNQNCHLWPHCTIQSMEIYLIESLWTVR